VYTKEKYIKDSWSPMLRAFVKRNSGRRASLENDDSTIIESIPFLNIEYEPIVIKNKMTLVLGNVGSEIFKPIQNPSQILITQNLKGIDVSLEISDSGNETFYLHFDDKFEEKGKNIKFERLDFDD